MLRAAARQGARREDGQGAKSGRGARGTREGRAPRGAGGSAVHVQSGGPPAVPADLQRPGAGSNPERPGRAGAASGDRASRPPQPRPRGGDTEEGREGRGWPTAGRRAHLSPGSASAAAAARRTGEARGLEKAVLPGSVSTISCRGPLTSPSQHCNLRPLRSRPVTAPASSPGAASEHAQCAGARGAPRAAVPREPQVPAAALPLAALPAAPSLARRGPPPLPGLRPAPRAPGAPGLGSRPSAD